MVWIGSHNFTMSHFAGKEGTFKHINCTYLSFHLSRHYPEDNFINHFTLNKAVWSNSEIKAANTALPVTALILKPMHTTSGGRLGRLTLTLWLPHSKSYWWRLSHHALLPLQLTLLLAWNYFHLVTPLVTKVVQWVIYSFLNIGLPVCVISTLIR